MSNTPQSRNYVDLKIHYFAIYVVFYPKNNFVQCVQRIFFLIRHQSDAQKNPSPTVIGANFRTRDAKALLQSCYKAFGDPSFVFERMHTEKPYIQ